nr:hypothetical protein [uncultured Roseibium sp.]
MNSFYPQDPSAPADRPDVEVPPPVPQGSARRRLVRGVLHAAAFAGVTFVVAVLLFVPVLVYNLGRVEALEVAGRHIPVSVFIDELGALFWGTAIIALSFTSLMSCLFFMTTGTTIRPRPQTMSGQDAMAHLTVLRLSRSER